MAEVRSPEKRNALSTINPTLKANQPCVSFNLAGFITRDFLERPASSTIFKSTKRYRNVLKNNMAMKEVMTITLETSIAPSLTPSKVKATRAENTSNPISSLPPEKKPKKTGENTVKVKRNAGRILFKSMRSEE